MVFKGFQVLIKSVVKSKGISISRNQGRVGTLHMLSCEETKEVDVNRGYIMGGFVYDFNP